MQTIMIVLFLHFIHLFVAQEKSGEQFQGQDQVIVDDAGAPPQVDTETEQCSIHSNCASCLKLSQCFWCSDIDVNKPNCRLKPKLSDCTLKNQQPSNVIEKRGNSASKVQPISFTVNEFVGNQISLDFHVQSLGQTPVDFYFLVDNSYSMRDFTELIIEKVDHIIDNLTEVTGDLKVGYGAFIDKLVMPAIDKNEVIENNFENRIFCYRNILSFTNDTTLLKEKVRTTESGYNYDMEENIMESLLEAAACFDQIKWRKDSKKLILVMTDAEPHIPSNSKYNNLYTPHDGKCYMDPDGFYTHAEKFAYPDFPLVERVLKEKQITPIFMVDIMVLWMYQLIVSDWSSIGAMTIPLIQSDFSNSIISAIQSYSKSSQVNTNNIEGLGVSIYKMCPGQEKYVFGSQCSNLTKNSIAYFRLKLIASQRMIETLNVNINGFGKLKVELNITDACPCERQSIANHTDCNSNGALVCGLCQCNKGNYGSKCNCDLQDQRTSDVACTKDDRICSGKGTCLCGICQCDPSYNGKFCQCGNDLCPSYDGHICGGLTRGTCECDHCVCMDGYQGFNCGDIDWNHPNNKQDCLNPLTGKYCDHGNCVKGSCVCEAGYLGTYCEYCSSCVPQCSSVARCVLHHNRLNFKNLKEDLSSCSQILIFNATNEKDIYSWAECSYTYDECDMYYETAFSRDGINKMLIIMPFNKIINCPKLFATVVSSVSVAGSVIIAILTAIIVMKVIHHFYKKREYQNFLKNKNRGCITRSNPLYATKSR